MRKRSTDDHLDAFGTAVTSAGLFAYPVEEQEASESVPALWTARKRPWRRRMAYMAAALVCVIAAAGGYLYWQSRQLVSEFRAGPKAPIVAAVEPELDVEPAKPAPGLKHKLTILAIGADRRYGESARGRSDTMLLIRVDPQARTASMLSLPRDLRVPIPGHGIDKVNAAYAYGGPGLLTRTIREYLGVKIDHFVQVDFSGFGQVVSNLGGVYLPIDGRYYHEWAPDIANNWASIDVKPGYQKVGREDALAWVRFRHLDSDFYRAARQQLFIREVGRQLRAKQSDIGALPGLLKVIAKATTSDLDGVGETLKLANTLRQLPPDRLSRVTIEANSAMYNGIYYLEASPAQKRSALRAWGNPGQVIKRHTTPKKTTRTSGAPPTAPGVVADGGRGAALVAPLSGLRRCAPTTLPAGYYWPAADAARRYKLSGQPAATAYATKGSGASVLWMWTRWKNPPILERPSRTLQRDGRSYDLYYESGKLRMVSWRLGGTRAWVTNTLRNELTANQMLALATSCRPL